MPARCANRVPSSMLLLPSDGEEEEITARSDPAVASISSSSLSGVAAEENSAGDEQTDLGPWIGGDEQREESSTATSKGRGPGNEQSQAGD
ncbi:unnamed protein product [Linum trigynum]|uniref:Uncharacterized protein n=1 Tax=Linum trigynum TaxID=586398 RepID=A0AAV2DBX7_9ROSI